MNKEASLVRENAKLKAQIDDIKNLKLLQSRNTRLRKKLKEIL